MQLAGQPGNRAGVVAGRLEWCEQLGLNSVRKLYDAYIWLGGGQSTCIVEWIGIGHAEGVDRQLETGDWKVEGGNINVGTVCIVGTYSRCILIERPVNIRRLILHRYFIRQSLMYQPGQSRASRRPNKLKLWVNVATWKRPSSFNETAGWALSIQSGDARRPSPSFGRYIFRPTLALPRQVAKVESQRCMSHVCFILLMSGRFSQESVRTPDCGAHIPPRRRSGRVRRRDMHSPTRES